MNPAERNVRSGDESRLPERCHAHGRRNQAGGGPTQHKEPNHASDGEHARVGAEHVLRQPMGDQHLKARASRNQRRDDQSGHHPGVAVADANARVQRKGAEPDPGPYAWSKKQRCHEGEACGGEER